MILKVGQYIYRKLGWSFANRYDQVFLGEILNAERANSLISQRILSANPTMISRLGAVETQCLLNFLEIESLKSKSLLKRIHVSLKAPLKRWKQKVIDEIYFNAGLFPATDSTRERFSTYFLNKMEKIDVLAIWKFVPGENYFFHKYCPTAIAISPEGLEPYFFSQPWSKALEGKRVLVIHPFSASIEKQYNNRAKIFKDDNILPSFKLITITAVQSLAGNKTEFLDWFHALNYMEKKIDEVDFDVALIGAGSYGLPLAAYVKEKGKISIHLGGALQILFGIKGSRWDNHPIISKFYNEHWVRPSDKELVMNSQKVENNCYW